MRKLALTLAVAFIVAAAPFPALAGVVFTAGNNPQAGEENILFANQGPAGTVTGTSTADASHSLTLTGTTTAGTDFTVVSNIIDPSSGLITSLSITPSSALSALILDPVILTGAATGTTLDYVVTTTDSQSFLFNIALGNGNNFLTITTDGGQSIANVSLSDSSGFSNLQSVHAVFLSATAALPEPATWAMMLLGFAGIGLAARRRERSLSAI
ncbi:MAG: PEPxxWA-CTERM sorting domain-containing protein [Sphingomonas sp.]